MSIMSFIAVTLGVSL